MRIVILPAVLSAVLYFTACGQSRRPDGIPISLVRGTTHLTVTVGDIEVPDILVDSGMPFDGLMVYNPRFAELLDLDNAVQVRVRGAGSGGYATALMVDSATFSIGDMPFSGQRLLMLQGDAFSGFPSNGIIGNSLFGHFAVEFNYDENLMRLHDPDSVVTDSSWSELPLYFKDNSIPWLDVSIAIDSAGTPLKITAYIDFASGDPIELLEREDAPFTTPEDAKNAYLGRGLSGDIQGKTTVVHELIIGGYTLPDITASFAPAAVRSRQQDADGIIGNGALQYFNLIFNTKYSRLFIKPNHLYSEVSEL